MMHFWLQKGIDGFRMDVISLISKRDFIDVPVQGFNETIQTVYANGPKVHEYLNEMNENVLKHYDILTVGEGPGITLSEGPKYVNSSRKELNMIFHFDHMFIDHGPGGKFDPVRYDLIHFKDVFEQWDLVLQEEGWSSIFLGNHDFPRIVSRFGNDNEFHSESAKAIALLLLTHRGTTYIYQGDEIGMTNVSFPTIEDYRDVETLNAYKEAVKSGREINDFLKAVHIQGRDNARTPVQWTNEENAGFSTKQPWINVNSNYTEINVEIQQKDPDSIFNFYRKLIQYRKSHDTLIYGEYKIIDKLNPRVFAYERSLNNDQYFIMINFSDEKTPFSTLDREYIDIEKVEVSNYNSTPEIEAGNIVLKPWEALIFKK
jgi:oligo-1,6-glucosidase